MCFSCVAAAVCIITTTVSAFLYVVYEGITLRDALNPRLRIEAKLAEPLEKLKSQIGVSNFSFSGMVDKVRDLKDKNKDNGKDSVDGAAASADAESGVAAGDAVAMKKKKKKVTGLGLETPAAN